MRLYMGGKTGIIMIRSRTNFLLLSLSPDASRRLKKGDFREGGYVEERGTERESLSSDGGPGDEDGGGLLWPGAIKDLGN